MSTAPLAPLSLDAAASGRLAGERKGIGIALSGGGYRATLFHMGALRRLNELGVLSNPKMRTISSVSGGSITSAFLALAFKWPITGAVSTADWNRRFAEPLRAFTCHDIRTGSFFRSILPGKAAVTELAKAYDKALAQLAADGRSVPLSSVPSNPEFVFCATDLAFGANWESTAKRIGDYQAGYIEPPGSWSLGLAVAASSCFPPVFQPLRVPADLGRWRDGLAQKASPELWAEAMKDLRLTDGGNYDNMGMEPIWKDHEVVLVSDAGGLFDFQADEDLLWRIQRYQSVQEMQCRALRRRWLIENLDRKTLDGTYWSVGSARTSYVLKGDAPDSLGYSKSLARERIATIRTDLDAFSDAEAVVLENHGYMLADKAISKWCPALATSQAPLNPPHPAWLPPDKSQDDVLKALANSHKRKVPLGRR